jgi:hypothetical protein
MLTVRAVRVVAGTTIFLNRIVSMTLAECNLTILMTGKAETVSILVQKMRYSRSMIDMTGCTALFHRSMNVCTRKFLYIMTGKADIGAYGFKQPLIRAVMGIMTGKTSSLRSRLMGRLFSDIFFCLLMTDKTLCRNILPEIRSADHSMM